MNSPKRKRSAFAIERGRKIRHLREKMEVSQARFAELIGVESREAVSQYESGTIKEIGLNIVRRLIELGMLSQDLLEDSSILNQPQTLPDISPEARRIAYAWDTLPAPMKAFLQENIATWDRLKKSSPVLASMLMSKPDKKSQAIHDRRMEQYTKDFIAAQNEKPEK